MISTIEWHDVMMDFPYTHEGALLFLWDGALFTGWAINASPETDPLQWQWECSEHAWPIKTHVRYWAYMPATMPPHHASDNWVTCPCPVCEALRAGDRGVRRLA